MGEKKLLDNSLAVGYSSITPQRAHVQMGLPQLLPPSKLNAAQASIQAGGDGVRDGVAMILTAIAEYNDMQGADGVNGSQVSAAAKKCTKLQQ